MIIPMIIPVVIQIIIAIVSQVLSQDHPKYSSSYSPNHQGCSKHPQKPKLPIFPPCKYHLPTIACSNPDWQSIKKLSQFLEWHWYSIKGSQTASTTTLRFQKSNNMKLKLSSLQCSSHTDKNMNDDGLSH